MKKQLLLLLVLILLPMVARANEVEIDGIYYNLITKANSAEVIKPKDKSNGSVVIPESILFEGVSYTVTALDKYSFYACGFLTSITLPNTLKDIREFAFYGCRNLTDVKLSNSLTHIGEAAFMQCYALTTITIPNSVTKIDSYIFRECTNLKTITIPNSVTFIGGAAFDGCTSLTSINIPNSVNTIRDGTFYKCSALSSITIPDGVTSIGRDAFGECSALTSISLPNSLNYINENAFEGCSNLTSITIPQGVNYIGDFAFSKCTNLVDFYCYAETVPYTQSNTFRDSYIEYATLYVPSSALNSYIIKAPWSNFGKIVAIDSINIEEPKCCTPIISYGYGKLTFSCETENVEYNYEITDADIKKGNGTSVLLTATYNISVYATKTGYINSEAAKATLCWIDLQPQTEGVVNDVVNVPTRALLIKSEGRQLSVQGAEDGTPISVHTADGALAGSAVSRNGIAKINTNLQPESIAIVKVGVNIVKLVVK